MTLSKNDLSETLCLAFDDLTAAIKKFDNIHVNQVKFYYAASLIEPEFAEVFKQASKSDKFWEDSFPDSYDSADQIYYLIKIDLLDKEKIDQIISYCILDAQNRHGYILNEHAKALRVLVCYNKFSTHTASALKYFGDLIQDLSNLNPISLDEIPAGMLALMELDFEKYKGIVSELANFLISKQLDNGSFAIFDSSDTNTFRSSDIHLFEVVPVTCAAIIALSRFLGPNHPTVISAVNYIQANRPSDGWHFALAPDICIALVEAGLGPKISKAISNWNIELRHQQYLKGLPIFIHTSPLFGGKIHIKQIHDKIIEMLQRAKKEVLISSLYVDMMYEELINMASRGLSIRIIMRPGRDAKGLRERINKNVVELLKIATNGNTRINTICHTRMMIIDSKEILISTADLTRDQLYDEFNAGIWTEHPLAVNAAIEFFENIWGLSDPS